jgi:(S)-2-hydroxyglutarate dehydrogenase
MEPQFPGPARESRGTGGGQAGVVVIGGGLVGLATAYALATGDPPVAVTLLEKEATVGAHQSTHNSGVLHAGLHYRPGSAKARLARSGIRLMQAFCAEHGVAHDICGKLVVATRAEELPRLDRLEERGRANGLEGLRRLGPEAAREIEPHAACIAALHVPEEGIVDFGGACAALAAGITRAGGDVRTGAAALRIVREPDRWVVETTAGAVRAGRLVACAGLQADRVARLAGETPPCRIIPFRGDYYRLRPEREHLVRHLIYPVPDPAFPFLGVHFTRLVAGGVEAGPNAVLALAREGYRERTVNLRDAADALAYPGLWRFLARHARMVGREVAQTASRRRFAAGLRRLLPELREDDLAPGGTGVRAQALLPSGALVEDFLLLEGRGALHVLNAPSPAATASLAIGREIADRVRRL